jgi:hypothetical protein
MHSAILMFDGFNELDSLDEEHHAASADRVGA